VTDQALKAAVERMTAFNAGRSPYKAWRGEAPAGEPTLQRDLHTLLAALSSQASVMEEMALALSDLIPSNIGDNPNVANSQVLPCDVTMGEIRRARTALRKRLDRRTLGDRHDD
jgi:hypothetical protein